MARNGHCTQCPGKCHWNVHFNQKYRWGYKDVKERKTMQALKDKYQKATGEKLNIQGLINKLKAEYEDVQVVVMKDMEKSGMCLNRIKEIALKPNPLSTPDYIDMLIEGEKSGNQTGMNKRVQALMVMKEKAETMAKVERGEKLLRNQKSVDFNP